MHNPIIKYFLSKVDVIISISKITKQRFIEWSHLIQKKYFILPNAITQRDYGVGVKSQDLIERYGHSDKTVLMTLGRLTPGEQDKGFDIIMALLPVLSKQIPHIAYLIIGDGEDRVRLEAKAQAPGGHPPRVGLFFL
jgi:phosphatidyl-myo-inositol dimannoside synthase